MGAHYGEEYYEKDLKNGDFIIDTVKGVGSKAATGLSFIP